jgi:type I restriction enzyme S subunit
MQVSRDEKIPIDCLSDYDIAVVSPAYHVFEIKNTEKILPQYLSMWFKRSEFDREAAFLGVGGIRGSMTWDDFCEMEFPLVSPEKQKTSVKAYQTIASRIALKRQINEKLEEMAGAVFEKLFETPIASNNKMVELGSIVDFVDGDRGTNYPQQDEFTPDGYCLFLNASNVTVNGFCFENNSFITKEKDKSLRKGKLSRNDIILTSRGTVGNIAFYGKRVPYENIRINSGMLIIRSKLPNYSPYFIFALLKSSYMTMAIEQFTSGSAQPQLPIKDLQHIKIPLPIDTQKVGAIAFQMEIIDNTITGNNNEICQLDALGEVLLARMTSSKVNTEKFSL